MKFNLIKIIFILCISNLIFCIPPIARRSQYGYSLGNRDAKVVLEMFVDLTCPDSAKSYFNAILDVLNHYGPDELNFIIHLHSLPYHRASFPFAQATHVINHYKGEEDVWKWISLSFTEQSEFFDAVIQKITNDQLYDKMADLAATIGVNKTDFLNGMKNANFSRQAKVEWKIGSARGVYETPTFILNDVLLDSEAILWKFLDWKKLIDQYI